MLISPEGRFTTQGGPTIFSEAVVRRPRNQRNGNVKEKVEPLPNWLFTQILPPWSSMNFREMASPSPVPSTFFAAVPTWRNSSNTASWSSEQCRPRCP